MSEYALEFEDCKEERSTICTFKANNHDEAVQIAIKRIGDRCRNLDQKVYYIRIWMHDSETVFDYGSHSEFYYMKEIKHAAQCNNS